jgi:hypothetical protein
MNKTSVYNTQEAEPGGYGGDPALAHYSQPAVSFSDRLLELELENSRLHRLVAELLIKNQQLRKAD